MKKYLANIDLITLAVAVIGVLLRFWHLSSGPDSNGLYPGNHIAWILLLCFSAGSFRLLQRSPWKAVSPRRRNRQVYVP